MTPISAEEVAVLLRRVAAGEVEVRAIGQSWDDTYAGNVTFLLSTGDTVVVFNDCDGLDYVDSVTLADGRTGEFLMGDEHDDPTCLLMPDEQRDLEQRLKAAPGSERSWWLERT